VSFTKFQLSDIRTSVKRKLDDTTFDDATIDECANDFQNELFNDNRIRFMEKNDILSVTTGDTSVALPDDFMNLINLIVLDDIADEVINNEKLCFDVTHSALRQLKEISDIGVKEVLVTSKVGGDTIIEKETINLTPSDYESIINAADKASLTLRVNQRHAKSGDVNVNAQTNVGIQTITRKIVD